MLRLCSLWGVIAGGSLFADATLAMPGLARSAAFLATKANEPTAATTGGPVIVSSCGTLAPGLLCTLFLTDDGQALPLENYGSANVGDRVWVRGTLVQNSLVCAGIPQPAIEDNTIGPCFEGCGELAVGPQGCPILRLDNTTFYFLENTANEPFGSRVWVSGCINPHSPICLPPGGPAIEDNIIGQCFQDCGVLDLFTPVGCPMLQLDDGSAVILEHAGEFENHERVWVEGCFTFNSPICPTNAIPVVLDNRIFGCFEGCGRLVPGIVCTQFLAEDGNAYALENYGSFGTETEVWVRGGLNPHSALCPPLPEFPGIEGNTIGRCFRGCGRLGPGPQGCPVFTPDGATHGLFIENTGIFPAPARIWVTGCLNPESQLCLPFTAPGIEDNRVCACYDGCGRIIQGPGCVLFEDDNKQTFWVENLDGIAVGARVHVNGCLGPQVTPCLIDVPFPSIQDNLVVGPLGDMNCDGAVTVGDIAPFVLAITNPAAYQAQYPSCNLSHADINCDGAVTVSDIGPFVRLLVGQ